MKSKLIKHAKASGLDLLSLINPQKKINIAEVKSKGLTFD